MEIKYKRFKVAGAGEIEIGEKAGAVTGTVAGFSFSVSWGRHAFVGGVLSRTEAKALAQHIIDTLEECTDTEEAAVRAAYKSINQD